VAAAGTTKERSPVRARHGHSESSRMTLSGTNLEQATCILAMCQRTNGLELNRATLDRESATPALQCLLRASFCTQGHACPRTHICAHAHTHMHVYKHAHTPCHTAR
jgi:hypothetical protein